MVCLLGFQENLAGWADDIGCNWFERKGKKQGGVIFGIFCECDVYLGQGSTLGLLG